MPIRLVARRSEFVSMAGFCGEHRCIFFPRWLGRIEEKQGRRVQRVGRRCVRGCVLARRFIDIPLYRTAQVLLFRPVADSTPLALWKVVSLESSGLRLQGDDCFHQLPYRERLLYEAGINVIAEALPRDHLTISTSLLSQK
jgi:hypothetical protein